MSSPRRMLRALSALLPLGAFGVSVALAAAPAKPIAAPGDDHNGKPSVAGRLEAIRGAVSQVTAEQAGLQPGDPNILKAWWGNWHPGWGNGGWRNWGNGWRNGGWGNGISPWANWRPPWGNGWRNGGWRNFWRNW